MFALSSSSSSPSDKHTVVVSGVVYVIRSYHKHAISPLEKVPNYRKTTKKVHKDTDHSGFFETAFTFPFKKSH